MDRQPVIAINNLWAGYEADTILEDISFEMFQDDYVGLIGPNGGGKTTLIRVILGLLKPDRAQLLLWGRTCRDATHRYVSQFQVEDKHFPISVWIGGDGAPAACLSAKF
jgi:zinc transport system ATP-binding protein